MKVSGGNKQLLINAVSGEYDRIIAERKRRAEDTSRNWTHNDEAIAQSLDKARDDLGYLLTY